MTDEDEEEEDDEDEVCCCAIMGVEERSRRDCWRDRRAMVDLLHTRLRETDEIIVVRFFGVFFFF